ncbi:SPRY domain membrane protein, specificity factor required for ubiquitination Ear1 [Schizosaccharomyces osmophilus]|uniref:SPRY domain membrane protein, specificity factor required for ubiquitination Ear1 n=1 Tax=Schizosaccharomyces osmophilus TaxID=2545709 RepID=A0AAE9WI51_9SCHI|nr:SPRY domain membrane protein, specificity factor required for ubiquitination Ear1 [Schizosaccharomyces osmophilus]WBW75171.1 SPRY domain membrane protein, specificity factor required for ubiquitination Ear1 [Schizosaccharomyces osmophilus]
MPFSIKQELISQDDESDDALLKFVLFLFISFFSTLGALMFVTLVLVLFRYAGHARILLRNNTPGELDDEAIENNNIDEEGFAHLSEPAKERFLQARDFEMSAAQSRINTDAKLIDFLQVQEKGVFAWHFMPNLDLGAYATNRTELSFTKNEECCLQTNLPLQRINEVYYWEAKLLEVDENTTISIGLTTKPYPPFRMPGWNFWSLAYISDGTRRCNSAFTSKSYASFYQKGDVIGVAYKPKANRVFFTRNGRRCAELPCTYRNVYPTVGATGPCVVHVNLGQAGYVFIEANIKKWRLAPPVGSLAPPPSYSTPQPTVNWDTISESSAQTVTQTDVNPPQNPQFNSSGNISGSLSSYNTAVQGFPSSSYAQSYPMHSMPARDKSEDEQQ